MKSRHREALLLMWQIFIMGRLKAALPGMKFHVISLTFIKFRNTSYVECIKCAVRLKIKGRAHGASI